MKTIAHILIGSVSTRRSIESMSMPGCWWQIMYIYYAPHDEEVRWASWCNPWVAVMCAISISNIYEPEHCGKVATNLAWSKEDRYLLEVYRYIELNPVRAEMVEDPGEYVWSSYQCNGLGKSSEMCMPHPEYQALGPNSEERRSNYRSLFSKHVGWELLEEIRLNTNKGLAIGNHRFKEEIEALTGRRVESKKRGRPSGWRKMKN